MASVRQQYDAAMKVLNDRHQKVVQGLLEGKDNTTAYVDAGYTATGATASAACNRLLKNVKVAHALELGRMLREERTQVTQDWIIKRLVDNVERSMQAEAVRDRDGNETGEYQYQGSVANKALELLGKHLSMFTDKIDHTTDGKALTQLIIHRGSSSD